MMRKTIEQRLKEYELHLISRIIAEHVREATDPNITPIMNELISVVKMIYGEQIREQVKMEREHMIAESKQKKEIKIVPFTRLGGISEE